ncbi:MAG: sodium:solute symporter family protein [Planctomycetes bacterium]|nr:sodium:solute symporter family protein [Planctomycetota bacterium]
MLPLIVIVVYLVALVGVGVWKSRSVHGQEGFALAGRGLSPIVLVGTLLATWTGTGSIYGSAEQAYEVGFPALVLPLSSVLGIAVLLLMIPRVRAHGAFTLQDLLEARFGPPARVLGSITLVSAYVVIVSYQLRAASGLLERVLEEAHVLPAGVEAHVAVLIGVGLLIGVYTALAGLMSVAFTDGFNGILMLLGLAIALPLTWQLAGGVDGVLAALPERAQHVGGHYSGAQLLSVLLPSFLLIMGDANLHQRFLSARSDGAARLSALLLIPGTLLVDGIILLTAIGGRAVLPDLDVPGHVVLELALRKLPLAVGALLCASILAVIVSTADSYLLSGSNSLVRDVWQRFVKRDASDAALLRASRVSVMLLVVVALVLAFQSDGFFRIALFAYTLYGVGITPVLLAALFWKGATPAGAIASMLVGTGTAIVWKANDLGAWTLQAWGAEMDAVVPGIVVATVALVGVSVVTRGSARVTSDGG